MEINSKTKPSLFIKIMRILSIIGSILFINCCLGLVLYSWIFPNISIFPTLGLLLAAILLSIIKIVGLSFIFNKPRLGYFLYTLPETTINILLIYQFIRATQFLNANKPSSFNPGANVSEVDSLNEFFYYTHVSFLTINIIAAIIFIAIYTYHLRKVKSILVA